MCMYKSPFVMVGRRRSRDGVFLIGRQARWR